MILVKFVMYIQLVFLILSYLLHPICTTRFALPILPKKHHFKAKLKVGGGGGGTAAPAVGGGGGGGGVTPFASMLGKKAAGGGAAGDQHGILEGISSLHSWIKTQTMIRPQPRMGGRGGGKLAGLYDEVRGLDSPRVKKLQACRI